MRNIPELNGLRGLAMLGVFFHHLCYASFGPYALAQGWSPEIRVLGYLSAYGDSGVDLFFVLSGFLITSILLSDRASSRYYQDFYWKRLLRIGPVFLAGLVVLLFWHEYRFVLVSLLLLANFVAPLHAVGSGPFWSLAIEEHFYLVWPTAVRKLSLGLLRWVAIGVAASSVILRYVFAIFHHFDYFLTFLRVDTLALGALLAILLYEGRSKKFMSRSIAALFLLGATSLAILPLVRTIFYPPTQELGVALLCSSIIGFSVCFSGVGLLAPLRSKLLLFFAQISYAMYVFHGFVFLSYDRHIPLPAVGDSTAYWTRLGIVFLVSVGISVLSRYALELPFQRLRSRVLSQPHATSPVREPSSTMAQM